MARDTAHPKVRENDARGCPPGEATREGKPLFEGANPGRIGNPPFEPTDQQRRNVTSWTKAGLPANRIAKRLGISRSTLDRHFMRELDDARFDVDAAIGASLVQKALRGNLTAQIFYLRTRAKWNTRIEHTGADGGPIKTFDLSILQTLEEKRVLLAVIDQLLEQHGEEVTGGDNDAESAERRPVIN